MVVGLGCKVEGRDEKSASKLGSSDLVRLDRPPKGPRKLKNPGTSDANDSNGASVPEVRMMLRAF